MEFKHVNECEIIFKDVIAERKYCQVFPVSLRGKTCVMKVVSLRMKLFSWSEGTYNTGTHTLMFS
jgi:hypothetical protein